VALQVLENVFILYFLAYSLIGFFFLCVFLLTFFRQSHDKAEGNVPGISILISAYNEENTIVHSIKSLLKLDYPNYEIIVANDGSDDGTLQTITREFGLVRTDRDYEDDIGTLSVKDIYRSEPQPALLVVDKKNSGKADSLNVGLNVAKYPYVVTIDADTILDRMALRHLIAPFLKSDEVMAAGGLLTVANGARIRDGQLLDADMPTNPLVIFQLIEYLISYTVGRICLSHMNSLLVLSGAFSMFDRSFLQKAGGFLTSHNRSQVVKSQLGDSARKTVCEDMEVVIRLHRFARENNLKKKVIFFPHPVAWTEVPENIISLAKQRNRWHRGLIESLSFHREVMLEPKYGVIGMLAAPYYLIFEFLSPLMKSLAIILLVCLFSVGAVDRLWLSLFLAIVILTGGLLTAALTVAVELKFSKSSKVNIEALRYKTLSAWIRLLFYSMITNLIYEPMRSAFQLWGIYDWVIKKKDWYKFARTAYGTQG
jgi:cellulose synthase/poly-beta-1,6-N-acetylglucosamine synthase-like glycosyltransferase